jgi:hypothetical protein
MQITEIKNVFPDRPVARYNVAAWQRSVNDNVVLIGREVEKPGEVGEPDIGSLVLSEIDSNGNVVHERTIWEPMYDSFYLEDPRALMVPDKNIIVIGFTAVLRAKDGKPVPFPAVVKIDSSETWRDVLPPVTLIHSFGPGKNLTPIDNNGFLFRPDDIGYHHKLVIFRLVGSVPYKIQDLQFPQDLNWAKWRMGTTMSPVWITPTEGLLILHGINIVDEKYIYNIGRARITKVGSLYKVTVHPDPIITPDTFKTNEGHPLVEELHNQRRVVYSCGGVIKKGKTDKLYLYVNVGDRTTFEVGLSLEELKDGLF